MFIKNIHVSLFSINLCLENGPGKSVFENVFVKYTKYGGSNTNTNSNTWFEIWSNTNTNTNTPYLYLYLYLQIQIRIWPQPCGLLVMKMEYSGLNQSIPSVSTKSLKAMQVWGPVEISELHVLQVSCMHYTDVIMGTIASQITSLTIFYSTVYSDADQRKYHSSTSLAFVRGIHRGPVNSPHKWPVTRKMFRFDDVIMMSQQQGPI